MKRKSKLNKMVKIALLGAIAGFLMLIEMPLAIFPEFLKIDISDFPAIIGALVMGPLAGMAIELIKILLNFILNGTITGGIGELANFVIGISLVLPIAYIYQTKKCFKRAVSASLIGTVIMALIGGIMNYLVLLPLYARIFGMKVMDFVNMASALPILGKHISTEMDLIFISIIPFNIVKGLLLTVLVAATYKLLVPPLMRMEEE